MFDETKLNHELSDEQSQVESALQNLGTRETAIDQNQIMYQAGWAAAVAEFELDKPAATVASRVWPALALSFAATTAACLFVMLRPANVGDSSASMAKSNVVPNAAANSNKSEDDSGAQEQPLVASLALEQNEQTWAQSAPVQLQNLFRLSMNRFAGGRNTRIQRLAAEAASPMQADFLDSRIDWDLEVSTPLTPQSIRSGSL